MLNDKPRNMNIKRLTLPLVLALAGVMLIWSGCKKAYFQDAGIANPHYNGSIYDYLAHQPYWFDTITYIIDHSGLKDVLQHDTVTFFSPTDDAVKQAMNTLNAYRYANLEDSAHLQDIDSTVWKYFLSMYILNGKHLAASFARVDPTNIFAYPGIDYIMYGGYILNIGLIYQGYSGAEAVGPRIISVTDITYNPANYRSCPTITVMTSDIQPTNGVIHVLNNSNILGFRSGEFARIAEQHLRAKK